MNDLSSKIAESLLQIKAIKLNPANHISWASGWYSPIFCDNRKILSYPAVRKQVYEGFERIIAEKYPDADIIMCDNASACFDALSSGRAQAAMFRE